MLQRRTKPAEQRIDSWNRKYNAKFLTEVVEQGKPRWLENVNIQFKELARIEVRAKQELSCEPGVVGRVAQYLCFVREGWKVWRTMSGPLASAEMSARIAKWTVRTLDPDIMWRLAFNLFSIQRPAAV